VRLSPQGAKALETIVAPISGSLPSDRHRVPAFSNGSVVAGKYLIEETIAQGGIGVVVVATHLALEQRVAIKYLRPKALSNPVIVERFVREARLAAQITSEHVVRVHDVGTLPDAGPYMVMEYLVGEDLGQTVQGGPLPVARAVDYVLQACDALAEAHALRIVHRDIKPENMFLAQRASNTPIVKIIDFGISKITPRRGEGEEWATQTAASERFGTPLYMSPEQLRSTSNVDARTDIWSLGIVLHELLTGTNPFEGDDLPQVCTSILTSSPARLTAARPSAPPQLELVILKCLEKDPGLRYRNVAELAQDLVPFGPASAASRVERIFEVVRRGGDSIRPPVTNLEDAELDVPVRSGMGAPDSRTVTTINIQNGSATGRRTAVALVLGLAFAGLPMAWAMHRSSTSSSAATPAAGLTAIVSGPAPGAIAPHPADAVPRFAPAPVASASEPPVESAAPSAVLPLALVRNRTMVAAPRLRTGSPGASAAKTLPSTPNSRRAQFGERE
jgi:serine/threonine-protein kinase